MLIPSIDIINGDAVQLVGGASLSINAGDPEPIAAAFSLAGDIAVIDLDAASGRGQNVPAVGDLVKKYSCRVGGGIRSIDSARHWLDMGASKVIIGTAATPEFLRALPRERVIVALDTKDGIVMSHGWQNSTGETLSSAMERLRPYTGGFLVTTIEREGRMVGLDLEEARAMKHFSGNAALTVAGGVASPEEVAQLDAIGIDVQAGMALYKNVFSVADCLVAILRARSDLVVWPTVVCDESGRALGLVYSNEQSLAEALKTRTGVYWSRKRGLWFKGLTSGATQKLKRVDLDCDRDTLRFIVSQNEPGFCHLQQPSCWTPLSGMQALEQRVDISIRTKDPASYANRLLNDQELLKSKIGEEAFELTCTGADEKESILEESADLFFFMYMKLRQGNLRLFDLERKLLERSLKVSRRPGNAKQSVLTPSIQTIERTSI